MGYLVAVWNEFRKPRTLFSQLPTPSVPTVRGLIIPSVLQYFTVSVDIPDPQNRSGQEFVPTIQYCQLQSFLTLPSPSQTSTSTSLIFARFNQGCLSLLSPRLSTVSEVKPESPVPQPPSRDQGALIRRERGTRIPLPFTNLAMACLLRLDPPAMSGC